MQGVYGIFLSTFLIGLREGLEATLIVSIVGAFLKRNGQPLRPMFAGVALAVAISVAVGVGLDLVSVSLPQRQQEMLETVIGAIAVVFVTSMVIWMNRNAARLKGELEREAQQALNRGGSLALIGMAFLAVLKEGFETSVFLLAAAETSHGSHWFAVLGAALGIAASIGLGVGLYYGGLNLNLGRFFRVTGVFLVLIAAGLVVTALRTAHEAGWVSIGQRQVFDFSSWMSAKSLAGALITGVFGIPADPRLLETLGWALYTVPVLVVFCFPARLLGAPRDRRRLLVGTSAVLLAAAALLAIMVPAAGPAPGTRHRAVTDRGAHPATVSLTDGPSGRTLAFVGEGGSHARKIELAAAGDQFVDGIAVRVWQARLPADAAPNPPTVSLEQLSDLTGGRLPVGLTPAREPGPFQAQWAATTVYTVLAHDDSVLSAQAVSNRTAVLSGGGLTMPKTVSLGGLPTDWTTSGAEDASVAARITAAADAQAERRLWTVWLPLVLAAFALVCALGATHLLASVRDRRTPPQERNSAADGEADQPVSKVS
jgi:high-affinity iron transporter